MRRQQVVAVVAPVLVVQVLRPQLIRRLQVLRAHRRPVPVLVVIQRKINTN